MKEQNNFLYEVIKNSIHVFKSHPSIYIMSKDSFGVYWEIKPSQDTLYDVFPYNSSFNRFNYTIKKEFEKRYDNLCLEIQYTYAPVQFEEKNYSRIIYYYYTKLDHHETYD